jgi:hypothetical protein
MARTFTLAQLTTRCQQRTDLENQTDFASVSEIQGLISTAFAELYSMLVASGLRYFETEQSVSSASMTTNGRGGMYIALPADYLSTIGVDYVANSSTGEYWPLEEIMVQERDAYSGLTGSQAQVYAVVGSSLHLWPSPPSGQTYKHVYVPQPTDYTGSATNTSVDVVTPDGEDFITWRVAVMAKQKEEADTSVAERNAERARERVMEWATLRSLNNPRRRIVGEGPYGHQPGDWWPR